MAVFQTDQPVEFLPHGSGCNQEILLMEHQFALSYGKPFIGAIQV
jgi:hypothetical protein